MHPFDVETVTYTFIYHHRLPSLYLLISHFSYTTHPPSIHQSFYYSTFLMRITTNEYSNNTHAPLHSSYALNPPPHLLQHFSYEDYDEWIFGETGRWSNDTSVRVPDILNIEVGLHTCTCIHVTVTHMIDMSYYHTYYHSVLTHLSNQLYYCIMLSHPIITPY